MSNHQSCLGQQMCDVAKITKARAQWSAASGACSASCNFSILNILSLR